MPRRTVARAAELEGTGLFTGLPSKVRVEPGASGAGVRFLVRNKVASRVIPARVEFQVAAERRTVLAAEGGRIETVEHLLAAVYALGYDDIDLTVFGNEVPIMDGSFEPFRLLLEKAGVVEQSGTRQRLALRTPVTLKVGDASYTVEPADGLTVDVTLQYAQPVIGVQQVVLEVGAGGFARDIAAARTFGFRADIRRARKAGTMRGAVDGTGIALESQLVVNTLLRWPDEFARHKAGDLIGDLALLGSPLGARVRAVRPSHAGNVACVRAILAAAHTVEE